MENFFFVNILFGRGPNDWNHVDFNGLVKRIEVADIPDALQPAKIIYFPIACIGVSTPPILTPLKSTTPLFLAKPPSLNRKLSKSLFWGNPHLYIGFSWTPPTKSQFFSERLKYKSFSSLTPSYLLKVTLSYLFS